MKKWARKACKYWLSDFPRTLLRTSEGDDTWDVYIFNTDLKNRLRKFAVRHLDLCKLKTEDKELGSVNYTVQKSRVSIHPNSPQSEARRKAASEQAKKNGFHRNNQNLSKFVITQSQSQFISVNKWHAVEISSN